MYMHDYKPCFLSFLLTTLKYSLPFIYADGTKSQHYQAKVVHLHVEELFTRIQ